jgi:hypothetical protein
MITHLKEQTDFQSAGSDEMPRPQMTITRCISACFRWILAGFATVFFLSFAIFFFALSDPRSAPVEGTDCPSWLPPAASNVLHRSQDGFGWWKKAEFIISESNLNTYAAGRGWKLQELEHYVPVLSLPLFNSADRKATNVKIRVISKALVYQRLQNNNGGIVFVYTGSRLRAGC